MIENDYDVPTREGLVYHCAEMRCEIEGIMSDYDIWCVTEDYRRMDGKELYREFNFLCDMMMK